MNNEYTQKGRTLRGAIIILCIICVIGLIVAAAIFRAADKKWESAEELQQIVDAGSTYGRTSVADCLKSWSFPAFNTSHLEALESIYENYYYKDLPELDTLARDTATAFITFYFEVTDLSSTAAVTDALIDCYILATGDRYGYYRTASEQDDYRENMGGEFAGIGITVMNDEGKIRVTATSEGSPASRAGILPNDIIIAVDGTLTSEVGYTNAINLVRGSVGEAVEIRILREDTEFSLSIVREKIVEKSVTYKTLDGNIGYIKISSFKDNTDEQFIEAVNALEAAGVSGFVFDLRNNLGGYLDSVSNMLSYLVPTGTTLASFSSNKKPLTASHGEHLKEGEGDIYESTDHVLKIPAVVICNERTASAGELFTAGIRDFNKMELLEASVVGTKTFGKGVMQSVKYFTNGDAITITTALYNPPLGVNFDGEGIIPDVETQDNSESLNAALLELQTLIFN